MTEQDFLKSLNSDTDPSIDSGITENQFLALLNSDTSESRTEKVTPNPAEKGTVSLGGAVAQSSIGGIASGVQNFISDEIGGRLRTIDRVSRETDQNKLGAAIDAAREGFEQKTGLDPQKGLLNITGGLDALLDATGRDKDSVPAGILRGTAQFIESQTSPESLFLIGTTLGGAGLLKHVGGLAARFGMPAIESAMLAIGIKETPDAVREYLNTREGKSDTEKAEALTNLVLSTGSLVTGGVGTGRRVVSAGKKQVQARKQKKIQKKADFRKKVAEDVKKRRIQEGTSKEGQDISDRKKVFEDKDFKIKDTEKKLDAQEKRSKQLRKSPVGAKKLKEQLSQEELDAFFKEGERIARREVTPAPKGEKTGGTQKRPAQDVIANKPTFKEFKKAEKIFKTELPKLRGQSPSKQVLVIQAGMKAQKIHPVIIEEITTPQRSRRPIDELGENISQTRANRLRRAETPTKNIKTQVDKIASAATRFRDKEAEVNRLKDFVFEDIKNIGGKVVAISKDGTFDIKISEGKQRISPRIQKKITQLRREAADAGAFSLETAGVGYSIAAAPLRIAQPTAQKGSITQNINNFIKAKKELAQLKNEFGRAKISALPAMVDDRFNRLIDGSEIRSFIGQGEKVPVEVQLRRKVSKFDPDLDVKIPGTGKTFKGEIKRLKGEGKKEGGRGAKFLATRQIKKPETIAKKSAEGQVINLNTPVTDLPSENKLTTRQRRQLNRKLGVPRTRFTRRKPAVNDKGEIGFKPRPQVDETKARRLNREISNDLNKLTKSQTGAFKIIGNTVPEFKLKGQINLVGKTFKNETDLAQMTQIFSDPRTESSRLLFVKGNEIKGVIGMTARLPGSTPSIPVDFHSNVDFLNVMMKKHGADSFYMLHNHPLGDVNPSIADIKVSSVQAQQNKTFRGHCIINHDKFSLIMPNKLKGHTEVTDYKGDAKDVFTYTLPLKTPRKREASINHPLLDASISKVQDVSDIAQRLNNQNDFGYIFSTKVAKGKIRVTGVTQISKNFLKSGNDKKIKAAIRRISKETGSEDTYLTLDKSTIEKHINTFSDLVSGGFIHDVVDSTSGISLRRGLRKRHVPVGGRASMSRKQFGKTIEETRIRILSQGGADQKTVALLNSFLGIRGKGKLTTAETTAFARDLGAISPNDARDFNSSIQKFDANISQALESPSISFNDKFDLTNLKNKIDTKFFKKTEKDIEAGDAPNPTFLDKVSELRAGMLLFRLSSVGKSIASNTARKLVQYPELKLSAWINKGVSRRSNTLQSRFAKEAEIDFATTWANRHRGINDAKNIMTESDKGKSQSIFFKREQIKGPAISGTKGKVIRAGLNAQGALDSIFRLPSEQGAIARHVYRKAMQESNFNHLDALAKSEKMMADVQSHLKAAKDGADIPDDIKTIIDKAKKEVEELTFQSELTGFAKKLSELRSSETTGGKVMRTLVPFFNTHMNILKQSFERTPLGLMTPRMSRLIKKHVRKELTELEAGELSDKMAQVVSGTGFMLGAAGMLYAMGDNMEITGDFDINTIKNKPQGWQPNSIRVGDIYISYQPFEPAASLLKIFGNAADTEHTIPNASLMGKSASVLAKSFLTNPLSEENFDLVNGLARGKADEILVDLAVSTVTFGMLADIGKIIDPAIKVKDSLTDKAIGKASIPGTTLTLPARVDIFGEDLITQSRGERAIKTITGVSVSQIKDSDERKFIRGLGIKPSQSRMKFKGVELTTQENLRVNKQAGIRFKEAVTSLMKSKSFTGLPKDRQTKILNRIRKKMISAYKKSLLSEANFRKRLTDKLKEGK